MLYLLRVQGDSMAPTLKDGQLLLALSSRILPVRAGRIIAFRRGGELYVKRALNQEADGWYVVGDNPSRSTDSRRFGAVSARDIRATAAAALFPPRWLLD